MEVLIKRYYERLPKEVLVLPETEIVFGWLTKCADLDNSVLIADLASNDNSAFSSLQLSVNEHDDIKDFRLKKLFISHFRKFDSHENCPYVLNFCDDKNVACSVFLTGKNGSGKTSIFTSLEYMLTPGHISTMLQRNIQYADDYFPYGDKNTDDIILRLQFCNDRVLNQPLKSEFSLIPFFCSDFDLQKIQKANDLQLIFTQNTGLGTIEKIMKALDNTVRELSHDSILEEKKILNGEFSDIMPADIFHFGGIQKHKTFENEKKTLGVIGDNPILRKVLTDNKASVENKEVLLGKIAHTQQVWNMGQDLNDTALYRLCRPKMYNYNTIADLLEKDEEDEAADIYRKVDPIEEFAWNFSEYARSLYNKFLDEKLNRDEGKRREVALRAIAEWDRQKRERQMSRLLRGNADLLKNYPERIGNLIRINEAIRNIYVDDKQKLLDATRSLTVKLLNEFTQLDKTNDKEEYLDIIEEQGKLVAIVRNDKVFGEKGYSTPKKYYNSFRYKLYCISIKVVLAFMSMKLNKINAPLIFDDVFTASDFDNTINICKFFEVLFREFKVFGLGEKNELQIILFTHDEVVMNSLSDIIDMISDKNEDMENFSYITGVLLDNKAIDERDCITDSTGNNKAYSLYSKIN